MPIVAMTREMGSLGTFIGLEVARQLGYEFLRNDLIKAAAGVYRMREDRLVGAVEQAPRLVERLRGQRPRRQVAYLEAAVLDAALRERVLLMGRWSAFFLRGVRHAVRVRVCAPPEVRAQRVMARLGVDHEEAVRRIAAYDDGVRARLRQIFDLDWTDPVLYDLVINTETITLEAGVRQVLALVAAPEFQPTAESEAALGDRAVAARVRAVLRASAVTAEAALAVDAVGGRVRLAGVVASEAQRDAAARLAGEVPGVTGVSSEIRVFRRPER